MEQEQILQEAIKIAEQKNIYQKLLAISTEIETVAKNLNVQVTKTAKYKAVGEADVLKAVKPLEAKYGVYSYPIEREIIESGTLESEYQGVIKKQLFERIRVVYRFINVDNPAEFVDITSYGDGIDSGDKSVGKAMTYSDKYSLMKGYKIVTGEDPDQEASGDLNAADVKAKIELDKELLNECKALNIDLLKVAKYLKKPVDALTNDDLKKCIEQKRNALGGDK